MTDVTAETHVNGTAPADAPAAAEAPCETCATPMEKFLGIFAIIVCIGGIFLGLDMVLGGRLTGMVQQAAEEVTQ